MPIQSHVVYDSFSGTLAELSSSLQRRPYGLQNLKYFVCFFQKKNPPNYFDIYSYMLESLFYLPVYPLLFFSPILINNRKKMN